jgi:hypothetical protein
MFNLSYNSPCEVQGTLIFDHNPWSLGPHKDIHGNTWDIRGYFGLKGQRAWVQACPKEILHPYFYDTSNQPYSYVSQSWLPYYVEVIKKEDVKGS